MLLEELFAEVLRLSFYGTIGCGVVLICILINYARAPRWISMALWGLVALRLVVPFSISSTVSLFQLGNVAKLSNRIETTLEWENSDSSCQTALEGTMEYEQAVALGSTVSVGADGNRRAYYYARENGRIEPAQAPYAPFLSVGARVWIFGMAVLWLWAALSYVRLKYRLRFSMRLCEGVYETDAVASPCVVGILTPRIYLTPALTTQQKEHILLHEQMHIRYLDPVWKLVSFAVVSIHWFNPFLWFMYKVFQGELEKTCDERVLARLGEDKKADYSESLLALAASKDWRQKRHFLTPVSFGENSIKSRIRRILAYRKPLAAVSVLVALISVAGCGVFLTTPARPAENTPPDNTADSQYAAQPSADGTVTSDVSQQNSPDAPSEPAGIPEETEANTDAEPGPDLTAVYEEISDNGVTYQARWDGIYRITQKGEEEQLYPIFPGTKPQMQIFENKLYFRTDKSYVDGALDCTDNAVRWINLSSYLDTGDLPMVRENALISDFHVHEGLITIYYSYPDAIDTTMLYADKDMAFNQKNITQLSESEQQQFGLGVTQSILQNTGTLFNVSNRVRGQNLTYMDLDNDGTAEKITLSPSESPDAVQYYHDDDPLAYYHLQIGSAALEGYGYNVSNILWALSLDGKNILLALYEDGPSADPYTHFFRYQNGKITEIGGFEDDIRLCDISPDGIITTAIRKEIVQTDWITVRWQIGQSGMLEEIPQDVYDFRQGNWVQLFDELPLHPAIGANDTFTVKPQNVRFLQTSADWNWIFLETEDGQQGWVHLDNFEVVELRKNVLDVFNGLYMAG